MHSTIKEIQEIKNPVQGQNTAPADQPPGPRHLTGNTPKNAGNKSAKTIVHRNFPVLGLSCASCAASVASTLEHQKGVQHVAVNYANQTARVDYDPSLTNDQSLQRAVRAIGYDLVVEQDDEAAGDITEQKNRAIFRSVKRSALFATLLSIPLVIISMWGMHWPYSGWLMLLLATPVVFVSGSRFFISAYKQLLHGKAGMDTLVALSTSVAYLYSLAVLLLPDFWAAKGLPGHLYFESAAVVICFILLGKVLEIRARGRTSADIKKLMGSRPTRANIIENGEIRRVPVSEILPGHELIVRPGEAIAVDGTVRTGQPFIDESMITGEPVAVSKSVSDTLYAGTLNTHTSFTMTATKVGSATTLSAIIRLVKEAQGSKAPIQRLVDKIAARFVAAVLIIAVITFLCWWLIGGTAQISRGILAMVSVLVIACPCALGLATPAAVMVGIGRGASLGILIKDAAHLQKLAGVTDIVLDKTGTLTTGKPSVQAALWLHQEAALKRLLSAIEQRAQHPLSEAVVDYIDPEQKKSKDVMRLPGDTTPAPLNDPFTGLETTFLPGLGLEASFNKDGTGIQDTLEYTGPSGLTDAASGSFSNLQLNNYYVGNEKLMQRYLIDYNIPSVMDFISLHKGDTIIYFGYQPGLDEAGITTTRPSKKTGVLIGILAIADTLKQDAQDMITRLNHWNIRTHILSGDHQEAVQQVADKTHIQYAFGGLLPEDKLTYIRRLQSEGSVVAMVGDGINDSAALAGADISIALSAGSAVAMDVAGVTLVGHQLSKITQGITLSRQTNKTISGNLFWAFIYNLIGIPVAAGILYPFTGFMLDPMIAGAAMALSSISVLMSSLRLRYRSL